MRIRNLEHVNICHIAYRVLQAPCNRSDIIKAIQPGVSAIEKIVTCILNQDVLPHAVKLGNAAELIGSNSKIIRGYIQNASKLIYSSFEGSFDRPTILPPEQIIYLVTACAIRESARNTDDINEYIARSKMGVLLDIGALRTEYDMSCYAFLIEYIEDSLRMNEKKVFGQYLKNAGNSLVTNTRLLNFFKKNDWYGDEIATQYLLGIDAVAPKVSEVVDAIWKRMLQFRVDALIRKEEDDLEYAFDNR